MKGEKDQIFVIDDTMVTTCMVLEQFCFQNHIRSLMISQSCCLYHNLHGDQLQCLSVLPAISTRNFSFWGGGGGRGGSDLNVLRTYTDTTHASDKRLIAKFGLDLVGSLLPQIYSTYKLNWAWPNYWKTRVVDTPFSKYNKVETYRKAII